MCNEETQIKSILNALEEGTSLRKAGLTTEARNLFSHLLENPEGTEVENAVLPPLLSRINIEAGMCAMLMGDSSAALKHFSRVDDDQFPLAPEASLLFARAQLNTDDKAEREEATTRLQELLAANEPNPLEIFLMCHLLLGIAGLQQNNFNMTEAHLKTLLSCLEVNHMQFSLDFAEKMPYFITDKEICALSASPTLIPLQAMLLALKKINDKMPNLNYFFSPSHKRQSSFSSFSFPDDEAAPSPSPQHW